MSFLRPSAFAAAFACVLIAIYHWRFTSISLSTGFGQDDLMNLYFAWREPFSEVLKANLFVRTEIVRPLGALFYVLGYHLWGYDGFPFRVVCYVVLWLNLPVTYAFVRQITQSKEIALLALLLHCVHSCYFPMYYGSGSCYDVFSFFFYYLAFWMVVRVRETGRFLRPLECVGVGVLFVLAVNSKEAAASLPAMLLVYELLRSRLSSISWVWREARAVLLLGCVTLVFLWARFTGPNNLLSHPAYAPVFNASRYLECTAHYLDQLSSRSEMWTPERSAVLLLGMGVLGVCGRSRALVFAWLLVISGSAPMAFVSPRGLSAYYIPVLGYAIYLAVILVRAREFVVRSRTLVPVLTSQAALFVGIFAIMWRWQTVTERTFPDHWADLRRIESAVSQFREHPSWFRPKASLLIASDPFGEYEWASTFIAAVIGNNRTVTVSKVPKEGPKLNPEQLARYTTVIAYKDGRYVEVDRSTLY